MFFMNVVGKKISLVLFFILFFVSASLYAASQLYVYPQSGVDSLISMINRARSSVDVVMYGFTDLRLYQALKSAKKRGVKVRVMLQRAPYKAADENVAMVKDLHEGAIDLRWTNPAFNLTHQKTLIIDHKQALIMTFNFTRSTFKKNRNFAVLTRNLQEVKEIEQVFQADWDRSRVSVSNEALVWSPNNALQKLLHFIGSAQKTLLVYNQEMSQYQIVGALVKAAKRGVHVQVIVPYANRAPYMGKLRYLLCHGVGVRLDKVMYIHAKAMLADYKLKSQEAFVGSMNFSDSGLMMNRELGIIVPNTNVANLMSDTFHHDWNASRQLKARCFH